MGCDPDPDPALMRENSGGFNQPLWVYNDYILCNGYDTGWWCNNHLEKNMSESQLGRMTSHDGK